jgi:hypothetical protein
VRSIRDLKGKTVSVNGLGGSDYIFLASMAAYVGMDPKKDITWVTRPPAEVMRLLADGMIDAEERTRGIAKRVSGVGPLSIVAALHCPLREASLPARGAARLLQEHSQDTGAKRRLVFPCRFSIRDRVLCAVSDACSRLAELSPACLQQCPDCPQPAPGPQ